MGSRTQALQHGFRACAQSTLLLSLLLLLSHPDQSHSVFGRHSRLPLNGGICGPPCPEQTLGLIDGWPWTFLPGPRTAERAMLALSLPQHSLQLKKVPCSPKQPAPCVGWVWPGLQGSHNMSIFLFSMTGGNDTILFGGAALPTTQRSRSPLLKFAEQLAESRASPRGGKRPLISCSSFAWPSPPGPWRTSVPRLPAASVAPLGHPSCFFLLPTWVCLVWSFLQKNKRPCTLSTVA